MEFTFLFDEARHLLAIGYNVGDHGGTAAFTICWHPRHAWQLRAESLRGRYRRNTGSRWVDCSRLRAVRDALLSWSGSMFEYLMPLLVMPTYEDTCSIRRYRAAVHRQIAYGRQRGVPWGMSESGYNTFDAH